jgi:hypothetical protein
VIVIFGAALARIVFLDLETLQANMLGAFDLAHQDVALKHLFALPTELAEDTSLEQIMVQVFLPQGLPLLHQLYIINSHSHRVNST